MESIPNILYNSLIDI